MASTGKLTISCAVGKFLDNAGQAITAFSIFSVFLPSDRCNNFLQLSDTIRCAAVLAEKHRNLVRCRGHFYLINWACMLLL